MFTKTHFWEKGSGELETVDLAKPLGSNLVIADYVLDIRRKRLAEPYINQGGCYLGKGNYLLLLANVDYSEYEFCSVNINNYTIVNSVNKIVNIGHANDCVYYNNIIYVCTATETGNSGVARFRNDSTFSYIDTIKFDRYLASITVDRNTGIFYGRSGNSLYSINIGTGETTKVFDFKINIPGNAFHDNIVNDWSLTGQGISFYNNMFYFCYAFPNIIICVDFNGNVKNILNIGEVSQGHVIGEIESCDIDENGRLYINSYGRTIDEQYELTEDSSKSFGFTSIFNVNYIDNFTLQFRNGANRGASNTIGTRRTIYFVANDNYKKAGTIVRHTGAKNYPFDSPQNGCYYATWCSRNSSRPMLSLDFTGDFRAYSKWISLYVTTEITINNASLGELHVGEGVSVKITGNGEIDKIVCLFGSTIDCRVDVNAISSSSGNVFYLLEDNVFTNLDIKGSIVRIDSNAVVSGKTDGCIIYSPTHAKLENCIELSHVIQNNPVMFNDRAKITVPTE